MSGDWLVVAAYLGAALVPYLIERFVFKKRLGVFAFLFWIFALQVTILYLSVGTSGFLENKGWVILAGVFKAIGAMAFMTIGVMPFIVLPLSVLIAASVLAFQFIRNVR
ncbi:hypothetical protein [Mesorhizobium sp. B2-3-4]|uniref:hypothetical protein n=1 Tax=Mesorhizobium sp. B2-3-4 TaxID=2589959 RepID=UPI001129F950|nr:hypothetical protein [Mesorhizobium sp. B2-3-4]TPM27490.1 hypothetical protein FJ967_30590 [Mesorhizobium sp. B2-3-4]